MSHNISEISHYLEGDSLTMFFTAKDLDSDLTVKDLTSGDIEWDLRPRSQYMDPVLETSDSGVSLTVTNATNGEFEVDIDKDTTNTLRGKYVQVIRITDSNGEQSSGTGAVYIIGIGP